MKVTCLESLSSQCITSFCVNYIRHVDRFQIAGNATECENTARDNVLQCYKFAHASNVEKCY